MAGTKSFDPGTLLGPLDRAAADAERTRSAQIRHYVRLGLKADGYLTDTRNIPLSELRRLERVLSEDEDLVGARQQLARWLGGDA